MHRHCRHGQVQWNRGDGRERVCVVQLQGNKSEIGAGLRSYFNWAPKKEKKNGNIKKEENNQSYFCTADVCVVMHIDI
jgi:hypothetical protein